jgi:hypothetical protein
VSSSAQPSAMMTDALRKYLSDDEVERRRRKFRSGEDLRYLPLINRKLRLRAAVPKRSERLLYCDHIAEDGEGLFRSHANTTWKVLSQSANPIRISLNTHNDSRFGTTTTASGSGARNSLSRSAARIPMQVAGTDVFWHARWH